MTALAARVPAPTTSAQLWEMVAQHEAARAATYRGKLHDRRSKASRWLLNTHPEVAMECERWMRRVTNNARITDPICRPFYRTVIALEVRLYRDHLLQKRSAASPRGRE